MQRRGWGRQGGGGGGTRVRAHLFSPHAPCTDGAVTDPTRTAPRTEGGGVCRVSVIVEEPSHCHRDALPHKDAPAGLVSTRPHPARVRDQSSQQRHCCPFQSLPLPLASPVPLLPCLSVCRCFCSEFVSILVSPRA